LPPQLVGSALPQAAVIPERLDGDVDTDLVPELEAVHDGPGRTRHPNGHAFDIVLLDPGGQRRPGNADDPNGRNIDPRDCRAPVHGQPDFAWVLRANGVKPQSRQQAHDALGHALRDLGQCVVLGWRGGGWSVEPPPQAGQVTLTGQPPDLFRMQPQCLGFFETEDTVAQDGLREDSRGALLSLHLCVCGAFLTRTALVVGGAVRKPRTDILGLPPDHTFKA
jgi:hypothetical protein